jgi:hypothetical protein
MYESYLGHGLPENTKSATVASSRRAHHCTVQVWVRRSPDFGFQDFETSQPPPQRATARHSPPQPATVHFEPQATPSFG